MSSPRTLRLPLTIGLASLQDLTIGFVLVPAGVAVLAAAGLFVYWAEDLSEPVGWVIACGLAVLGFGITKLRRAWQYRPSDMVFGDAGVHVAGGGRAGTRVAWTEVDEKMCSVKEVVDKDGADKRWILVLRNLDIAEADDDVEGESFREIARAVVARVRVEAKVESKESTSVLACAACGAPVAPTADDEATCGHCGKSVKVPTDVRDRVRATATLTRQSKRAERLVGKLLDQPGAGSTTALLWISFILIGSAWPITGWAFAHLAHADELTFLRGIGLGVLPFLFIADGFFLSRLRLVDRRALGTLTTTFGANPPERKGEPLRCRSCMAPLPARATVVVECVFCGASNITGVDLRGNARRTQESAKSLQEALANRGRERRKWRLRTLASVPLFVITALVLRSVWNV